MKRTSDEVFYADEPIVRVGKEEIKFLKYQATITPRRRARLCAHPDTNDRLHEMFIVHTRETYVRPQLHLNKSESLHLIEGSLNVVIFDKEGQIVQVIPMGDYLSGRPFYYRIPESIYHTVLISSELVVFHETTTGPFDRADTVFAPWSPEENDSPGQSAFMARLESAVQKFLALEGAAR